MSKPPPPAPTASAVGPCPTLIQISRTPGSLPSTFATPDQPPPPPLPIYWRKYVHEVLFNRLGGRSLSRKSVVRLTYRPDMTLDVYRGRKRTTQQQQYSRTRAHYTCRRGGCGLFGHFPLACHISFISPSLADTSI